MVTAFLSACATHTVKSTSYTPVIQDSQNVPEDLLLDVGVAIFDPGLDDMDDDQEELTNPQIRVALNFSGENLTHGNQVTVTGTGITFNNTNSGNNKDSKGDLFVRKGAYPFSANSSLAVFFIKFFLVKLILFT